MTKDFPKRTLLTQRTNPGETAPGAATLDEALPVALLVFMQRVVAPEVAVDPSRNRHSFRAARRSQYTKMRR